MYDYSQIFFPFNRKILESKIPLKVIGTVKKKPIILLTFLSWSGSHTCWGQPFRLCHMTTGRYMGLTEEKGLHLVERDKADVRTTSFCFRSSKVSFEEESMELSQGRSCARRLKGSSRCIVHQFGSIFIHFVLYSRIISNTKFVFTGETGFWYKDQY